MKLIILFTFLAIAFFIYLHFKKISIDEIIKDNKKYYIIIFIAFAIGIFARVYEFSKVTSSVNQDEAMAGYEAYSLSQYGEDRFGMSFPAYFTAWKSAQMNVLMSILMIPFIKIFGLSVVSIRLPNLIISIISMIIFWKFVEKVFGKKAGLVAMLFIAINPWHIIQSRWTLECNVFPHLLLLAFFLLYLGLNKNVYMYLSMAVFGISMYAYGISYFAVPLMLILILICLIVEKQINIKQIMLCFISYIFFAWPIFAVMIVNYFKLSTFKVGFITIPFFPENIRMNDILLFSIDKSEQFLNNIRCFLKIIFQNSNDIQNVIQGYGTLYIISIPFLILGIYYIIKEINESSLIKDTSKENKNKYLMLNFIFIWLLVSIVTGLIINNVNVNRINIIFYPLCILTSLGIYYILFEVIKNRYVSTAVFLLYMFIFTKFEITYFTKRNDMLSSSFYFGFKEAIVYAQSLNTDSIYITDYTQYVNSEDVSEILTLFYTKIDPHFLQNKEEYSKKYIYKMFRDSDFVENNNDTKSKVYLLNKAEYDLLKTDNSIDIEKYKANIFENYVVLQFN